MKWLSYSFIEMEKDRKKGSISQRKKKGVKD